MRRRRSATAYLARSPGWWSVPGRLAGVVRRRRTMVPAARTYLLAAVAGAVLGVAGQLAFGWPWWLVAAGAVAAVELGFLASAFRGGGRPLATEVLLVVDPARGMRRERRAMEEWFRAAPFPLYGLPAAWPGPRYLGGSGSRQARGERPVVTSLSLGHGDPAAERGLQLVVEVVAEPDGPRAGPAPGPELRAALAEELAWTADLRSGGEGPPGPGGGGPGGETAGRPGGSGGEPGGGTHGPGSGAIGMGWTPVVVPVEGRAVGFEVLAEGRDWVAWGEVEGRTLVLRARDLPVEAVELVRVDDVEPYLEGSRRLAT